MFELFHLKVTPDVQFQRTVKDNSDTSNKIMLIDINTTSTTTNY